MGRALAELCSNRGHGGIDWTRALFTRREMDSPRQQLEPAGGDTRLYRRNQNKKPAAYSSNRRIISDAPAVVVIGRLA